MPTWLIIVSVVLFGIHALIFCPILVAVCGEQDRCGIWVLAGLVPLLPILVIPLLVNESDQHMYHERKQVKVARQTPVS